MITCLEEECKYCHGTGVVLSTVTSHKSRFVRYDDLDPDDYGEICPVCNGTGVVQVELIDIEKLE